MRLWRMVCALCRELRRLWHEVTEATNFFRWISPKAVVLSFPVWTPSHPLFCHVFFFFSESLLTSEVKTDENLGVLLVFLLMLMRRPGGSPKKQGGEAYVGLLTSQVPSFFLEGILQWKKHLSTQNSKCSSFLIQKCWFFLFDFFWWWRVAPANHRATEVLKKFYGRKWCFGEDIPGCRKHPSRDFGKDSPPFIGFLNPSPVKSGEVA